MEPKYARGEQGVRDLEFVVNEERQVLNNFFKKFKVINLIVLIVTLAVVTFSFIVLFPLENGMTLGFVISIVFLVGSMVYMRFMKQNITKKGNAYIAKYYQETSEFVYGDLALANFAQDVNSNLPLGDFVNARIIKDISNSGSRNLVSYNLGKYAVRLADFGAYKIEGKQNKIVFAGKLMVIDHITPLDGRVLMYRKPDVSKVTNAAGPDDTGGMLLITDTEEVAIYAENESDLTKLGKDFVDAVAAFPRDLPFVDMTLSFIEDRLTIAISYDDELMAIPLPVPFVAAPTIGFKRDLEEIHKLVELL